MPVIIIIPVRQDLYREALNIAADISDLRPLRTLLAACLMHEMAFAVAEGSADPTIANEDADPEKPVPPRGRGYTGNGP